MKPTELRIDVPTRPYTALIGPGALEQLGDLVAPPLQAEVVALVTDANVAALHGERARAGLASWGLRIEQLTLEPGEATKSPRTAEAIWRWLASSGIHRGDVVVALGGGVVGDLAGFSAATFHRGIAVVQAPTSLLAQVDASIGGKTGVDLPEGKNLVGAFHQPIAVVADTDALQTLPEAEYLTGLAEAIKHGLIADEALRARLLVERAAIRAREPAALAGLVLEAAAVKAKVVAADEREGGERVHLNYGHTLAHALETLGGYERWTHGRAVAIGMMFAAAVAVELGYRDRTGEHRALLEGYELPTGGAGLPYEQVAAAWSKDKKYEAGMRFVVLEDLGRPTLRRDVPASALRKAYEAVS